MIRGVFASHSSIVGDRASTMAAKVLKTEWGGSVPLLALSSGMKEEKVSDTSWSWIEDTHISGNSAAYGSSHNSSVTTINVVDTSIWTANSVLLVESSGEQLFVSAIPSSSTLTVIRGFAGTTPATIPADATIQLIGTAYEEGGGQPTAVMQTGESFLNNVQIFKNGWAITGTAAAVSYITGSKLAESKAQCTQYHAEAIERAFLWGRRAITSLNGKEMRLSNGLLAQIEDYGGLVESANYGATAGAMSMDGLQDFMRVIFQKAAKGLPNERIAYTSDFVLNLIQKMTRKDTHYELTVADTEYGFNVGTLNFLGNKLKLMTHPMMSENATWSKQMYVLHPGLISKRVLRSLWTQEFTKDKSTNNGVDADSGYVAQEIGFQLKGAELHGIMTNIQTAAASA